MTELRETYYQVFVDGNFVTEGSYEQCDYVRMECSTDNIVEIYKITVFEELVV